MSNGDGYRYSHFSIQEEADLRRILVFRFDHPAKPPSLWSIYLNEGATMAEVGNGIIKLGELMRGSSPIKQNATSSASESSGKVDTADAKQNAPQPELGALRDRFAETVLMSLLDKRPWSENMAGMSYAIADAMLKAREAK